MELICTLPGREHNWVEIAENWTKKEVQAMDAATVAQTFDVWYPTKVTQLYVQSETGEIFNDPKAITYAAMDDVDYGVLGFMVSALYEGVRQLFLSGRLSAKVSSNGTAVAPMKRDT